MAGSGQNWGNARIPARTAAKGRPCPMTRPRGVVAEKRPML